MRHLLSAILIFASVVAVAGQEKPSVRHDTRIVMEGRSSIVHLAPRFTTTIRLPESVSSVVVGDPSLFQVEHSANEPLLIFVKPITSNVAQTNLLITTIANRHYLLLLSNGGDAADPTNLDLLVECRTAGTSFIEETYSPSLIAETLSLAAPRANGAGPASRIVPSKLPLSELVDGQRSRYPSRVYGDRLRVGIGEVIERGDQFVVLFCVFNAAAGPLELMPPQIQLAGQIKSGILKRRSRWTTVEQIPVQEFRLTSRKLRRGERCDGLVVFERPSMKQSNERLLLQIAESAAVDQLVLVPFSFSVNTKPELRGGQGMV
jgi:hypothetical protein